MNDVVKHTKPFQIVPQNLQEAMKLADIMSASSLCPPQFKGKSGDVLIAMQMGSEVGLSPMQALQSIAVINNRPCVWGDAAIALVKVHPRFEYIKEWHQGDIKNGNRICYCEVKRKGEDAQMRSFSIEQAIRAGLWEKAGTWKQYPDRMLQLRARGFALRDVFPDALKGLSVAEEVMDLPTEDYHEIKIDKPARGVAQLKEKLGINVDQVTGEIINGELTSIDVGLEIPSTQTIDDDIENIMKSENIEKLEETYRGIYKFWLSNKDKDALQKVMTAKDKKKAELEMKEFNDEIDKAV